jgi:proteasome activator subunit 4
MILTSLLTPYSSDAGLDLGSSLSQNLSMEDDDMSVSETPIDSGTLTPEQSPLERQRASLQTYLRSVPYECESVEEMQAKLEFIVGKIVICARAKNWLVLTSWDAVLQWWAHCFHLIAGYCSPILSWLLMRYPMAKTTRAKLVRLYYELCVLPGMEPRVIRSWADMLSRLLSSGPKRKLQATDLELPWQPLWHILQKDLWPKKRIQDSE